MSSVQILGLADLQADFLKLAKAQSTKALRRATVAGANVIRDEARARAPKKTGKLKRNIVTAALKQKDSPGIATAGVRVRTKGKADSPNNAFYWRFVELGTQFMKAEPFMRPAFDASIAQAEGAIRTEIARAIDQVVGGGL
ncbi:HK97-gp10 family putative phage morphogenesis protein [Burkholderia multivorans]|uniref:Bacteriophage protein n=1 Tax=Burkholderia multivorans (strain ATCC 17616 / 249) TaxID=395019 RepID=A0A0H3KMM0_BURM1|nr:HK97-gp10 family putative phage morphogenesis protein [Burkholderia multivorans]YP_355408.1 HK97 gp10 family protein [Burkholderia phage Bcep176]ABA60074.1 gp72 [Burkholderia phage Bcep176]ABX17554.1 phage protein, HK97 gp10 family [Burkholderia multivorans ATCC 17616]MCL4664488.1 HK97 gp10 family phage protein [Burkholderia multivorans]MCO1355882.1 HK97 gp10 family phage protein [Burkholderia multivorans]MCO1415934.1 HK97 gp10 family phage protein [Burkholderia multivorans]